MAAERLKIAVFIDFDNIEIGVKTTLGRPFDVGTVLEAIKERGEVVTKFAYGDWQRAGDHSRQLTAHAIHMVQRNLTPGGDKNGADINLALDALEMAFTHNHINAFVIISGDSDFIALVEKLKQYDKKVFVVGGRAFTSVILQKNCNEFIAYENLLGGQAQPRRQVDRARPAVGGDGQLQQVFPLVKRALQVLSEREVSPQLGLLKSTLLQLDSTFSEREYGAGTFRDFVQKLAQAGLVKLKGSDRSVHVELREADGTTTTGAAEGEQPQSAERGDQQPEGRAAAEPEEEPASLQEAPPPSQPVTPQPAEALRAMRRAFQHARTAPRWPMYVRNVKQFVRSVDETFDERRYGVSNIVDILRIGQREGIFRLDRDRRGSLRVFPGPQLQTPVQTVDVELDETPQADVDAASRVAPSDGAARTAEFIDAERDTVEPETVDAEAVVPVDDGAGVIGVAEVPGGDQLPFGDGANQAATRLEDARAEPAKVPRSRKRAAAGGTVKPPRARKAAARPQPANRQREAKPRAARTRSKPPAQD